MKLFVLLVLGPGMCTTLLKISHRPWGGAEGWERISHKLKIYLTEKRYLLETWGGYGASLDT